MTEWTSLDRGGTRIALAGFGGSGEAVLFLHGLVGHAEEWQETADWLMESHAVFGLDLRGHGRSERSPEDVSVVAHVADVAAAIQHIGRPVVLVGHSVSGIIAVVVAADHPDLVSGMVVSDASVAGADDESATETAEELATSLSRWPVPFGSRDDAIAFFGGPSLKATAWVAGLEAREDGLWPRFEIEVMANILRVAIRQPYWDAWERVKCPVLLVRAGNGVVSIHEARAMADRSSRAQLIEIARAAHDVHLDRPDEWRRALSGFLAELP